MKKLKWVKIPLSENEKSVGFTKKLRAEFEEFRFWILERGVLTHTFLIYGYHKETGRVPGVANNLNGAKKEAERLLHHMYEEALKNIQFKRVAAEEEEKYLLSLKLPSMEERKRK